VAPKLQAGEREDKMKTEIAARFTISAAAALLASWSPSAHALTFERSISALYCSVNGADMSWGSYRVQNSTSTTMSLSCGIPSDTSLLQKDISSLNVVGSQCAANKVTAYACLSYYAGGSPAGACGTAGSSSTAGYYDITPSVSAWSASTNSKDMPYVVIYLDGVCPGEFPTYNSVYGMYVKKN